MSLPDECTLSRRGALALAVAPAVAMMTPTPTYAAVPQLTSTSRPLARPGLVWVVGDSITVLGRFALRESLRGRAGTVAINAVSGRMVDAIAASTAVVFVTVYRKSQGTPPATLRAMASYSRWMRDIAAERDNVGTARWRRAASHHPVRLLADGVHPTVRGTRVWADLIGDAVDRSWRSTALRV